MSLEAAQAASQARSANASATLVKRVVRLNNTTWVDSLLSLIPFYNYAPTETIVWTTEFDPGIDLGRPADFH
jgi:hypothetical protein